jgi:hypothetical protein
MKKLKLAVAEPCHENWNDMTPDQRGRFCAACQKTVVDFTHMTDRQIAEYFKKPAGSVCGRFYSDQLNREMTLPEKHFSLPQHFFRYSWPAFLLMLKSCNDKTELMGDIAITTIEKTDGFTTIGFAFPEIAPVDSTSGVFQKPVPVECKEAVGQANATLLEDTAIMVVDRSIATDYTESDPALVAVDQGKLLIDSLQIAEAPPKETFLMGAVVVSHSAEEKETKEACAKNEKPVFPERLDVQLYSNPVTKGRSLTLFFHEKVKGLYQVYSASGSLVQKGRLAAGNGQLFTVPFSFEVAGAYFISIADDKTKKVVTQKFIVQ